MKNIKIFHKFLNYLNLIKFLYSTKKMKETSKELLSLIKCDKNK